MNTMKPSQAILKGSKNKKQCTTTLCRSDKQVCALGALALGYGATTDQLLSEEVSYKEIWVMHKDMQKIVKYPPNCDYHKKDPLYEVIYYLNDTKNWSFKKIAAWLKSKGY